MKKINVGDAKNVGEDVVAGKIPFHSLLQTTVPKDVVIQKRGAGETISYNFPLVSSDDD